MFSVTKRIEFCYGHRLMDYDGICRHPHGHNAVVEIDIRADALDQRNMVCDFGDIKRIVKGWIDSELDHQMILRGDDPLVTALGGGSLRDVLLGHYPLVWVKNPIYLIVAVAACLVPARQAVRVDTITLLRE